MNVTDFIRCRFAAFSAVGAGGFILQLGALWLLTGVLGIHYLASTVIATELAIVLNFFGHNRWTWSDRPTDSREGLRRFYRFHATNGVISLAGGAFIMPALMEIGGMHYLLANVLTVGLCAVANLISADRVVYTRVGSVMLALALVWSAPVEAAELGADTLAAFDRYVRVTEARMDAELNGKVPFLAVDRLDEVARQEAYSRLKRGDVVIDRLVTQDAGRTIASPRGLIHHWTGTTFIPGATIGRTVALMQAYDRYQDVYAPNVRRSRTVDQQDDRFTVHLQLYMKKVIGVVLNTEYDVWYTRPTALRAHVRSYSTRIAEVRQPGTEAEAEAPVGNDSGFLWRFYNYCSLEGRAEGTFVQCESVSLSRAIPSGLGWIVGPFVTSIPKESLEFTLSSMRTALARRD